MSKLIVDGIEVDVPPEYASIDALTVLSHGWTV
jgi:hypothetical protein